MRVKPLFLEAILIWLCSGAAQGQWIPPNPVSKFQKEPDGLLFTMQTGTLELQVCTADEDDNNTYDYEKGAYSTVALHWNNSARMLSIGERKGSFPGMLAKCKFRVVIVGDGHGAGIDLTSEPDQSLEYEGKALTVRQ